MNTEAVTILVISGIALFIVELGCFNSVMTRRQKGFNIVSALALLVLLIPISGDVMSLIRIICIIMPLFLNFSDIFHLGKINAKWFIINILEYLVLVWPFVQTVLLKA